MKKPPLAGQNARLFLFSSCLPAIPGDFAIKSATSSQNLTDAAFLPAVRYKDWLITFWIAWASISLKSSNSLRKSCRIFCRILKPAKSWQNSLKISHSFPPLYRMAYTIWISSACSSCIRKFPQSVHCSLS